MNDHTQPPRRSAVALRYDPQTDPAPQVIAKGYGEIADAIIRHAKQAGLYVHAQPELVSLLMQIDLDTYIPPELYQVVAELLAWVYQIETQHAPLAPSNTAPSKKA